MTLTKDQYLIADLNKALEDEVLENPPKVIKELGINLRSVSFDTT